MEFEVIPDDASRGGDGAERWLPVPRYAGWYEVSDQGRVYSLPRGRTRGGVLRLSVNSRGYHHAALCKYGRVRCVPVGRLVLTAFERPPRRFERARHGSGGPGDDSLANLRWTGPDWLR